MTDAERWEAIWRGAEESLARLLGADDVSDDGELAPVVRLVPPVEPEEDES